MGELISQLAVIHPQAGHAIQGALKADWLIRGRRGLEQCPAADWWIVGGRSSRPE